MRKTALVFGILFLAVAGWWRLAVPAGAPGGGDVLRVLFTGESLGRIDACVCDSALAGGLEFRQGYLRQQTGAYLLVDTGCFGSGAGNLEILRSEEVLRAMKAMGYHAANLGETELALGLSGVNRLCAEGVPLVSLNVKAVAGASAWRRDIAATVGGVDVLVAGLTDESFPVGDGLVVEPHAEALARWVREGCTRQAALVVLADLRLEQVRAIARDFPEITLILFRGRGESHPAERVNRTVVASVYGSRYIADLSLRWKTAKQADGASEAVELNERFAGSKRSLQPLPGIETEPQTLAFGQFKRGQNKQARLTIRNRNAAAVTLGRVFSPCTCFAMTVNEASVPAGGEATIDVTLHSLELSGDVSFPLYVEVKGAASGILAVRATASVAGKEVSHAP